MTAPPLFPVLLLGTLIPAALMILTWKLSVRGNNYSFVDVCWSLAFTPVAVLYAAAGAGWGPRRLVIALLLCAWSLRLGIHLWKRVARHHPAEDGRYRVLRERWIENTAMKFLGFFFSQAILVWLLMLPVFLICRNAATAFHPLEIAGFALWFLALAGEGIADRQLERFKQQSRNDPMALCRAGLWSWSRHPNYFFQSLLWWGLFLVALPAAWGWLAILAPVTMLYFLLEVTGVPLTEELAVEKRGEIYREYQRDTSAFVPLPPRQKTDGGN